MSLPNLRSPHETTRGIVYFARMVDKIRLHQAGNLPADYVENLGVGFDGRCCRFLGVEYADLVAQVQPECSDEALLEWCFAKGHQPSEEQVEVWNGFMRKFGWNDAGSDRLKWRLEEAGAASRTDIATFFDFIDFDEGRKP